MLSTDELFHFTPKLSHLLSIIEIGFKPKFNLEYAHYSDLFERPAHLNPVPMVCFCDIPLHLVDDHSSKYGKYAIGLTKEWGSRNGLSPVIYVHGNSRLADSIGAMTNSFSSYKSEMIGSDGDISLAMMITMYGKGLRAFSCYLKQYENYEDVEFPFHGKVRRFPKGRFYEEREWRYVPMSVDPMDLFFPIQYFDDVVKTQAIQKKLEVHKLGFELTDIRYIIVEQMDEKDQVSDSLRRKYGLSPDETIPFPIDTMENLTS